ncbi:hypothetical protein AMQ84_23245 [Paenibacillus riograndensis]|uniref:Uncharacterized protein n=1 Tax=Paenibacillus riograndensis TaxID=483937 RepID=A0A132TPV7_9BACL|nr:hypothetical protein AMQ84_23245 [Paenibacillus riograndensis]KWX87814.1 hypothetical protein AMQ83_10750 [Paenibacillus riograndensis]
MSIGDLTMLITDERSQQLTACPAIMRVAQSTVLFSWHPFLLHTCSAAGRWLRFFCIYMEAEEWI